MRACSTETTYVLDKADYFEFMTLLGRERVVELDAMKAAQDFGLKMQAARTASLAKYNAIAQAYGFDPSKTYRFDDTTYALIQTAGEADHAG